MTAHPRWRTEPVEEDPAVTPLASPFSTVAARQPAADTVAGAASSRPVLRFPCGLPGFPHASRFRLEPVPRGDGLLLLRSLDDPDLRFVVATATEGRLPIAERDVSQVCDALGWPREATVLLFVVTLGREGEKGAFVNLRAPIFLDTERAIAVQVVLPDASYPFRAPLAAATDR